MRLERCRRIAEAGTGAPDVGLGIVVPILDRAVVHHNDGVDVTRALGALGVHKRRTAEQDIVHDDAVGGSAAEAFHRAKLLIGERDLSAFRYDYGTVGGAHLGIMIVKIGIGGDQDLGARRGGLRGEGLARQACGEIEVLHAVVRMSERIYNDRRSVQMVDVGGIKAEAGVLIALFKVGVDLALLHAVPPMACKSL